MEKILLYNASCEPWNGSQVGYDGYFINYNDRTEMQTVNGVRRVWAEIYYDRELTAQELRAYEIVRG